MTDETVKQHLRRRLAKWARDGRQRPTCNCCVRSHAAGAETVSDAKAARAGTAAPLLAIEWTAPIVHAFSLIFSRQCKHELPSAIGRLSSVKLILAIVHASRRSCVEPSVDDRTSAPPCPIPQAYQRGSQPPAFAW